jgi:hypothetical protein
MVVKSYGTHGNSLAKHGIAYARERQLNHRIALLSVIVPLVFFAALYAVMSFSIHYSQPLLTYGVVGLAALVVLATAWLAAREVNRSFSGHCYVNPYWYTVAAVSMLVAFVLALIAGSTNYWINIRPYNQIDSLTFYQAINPVTATGAQLMDAGKITFTEDAKVDVTRFMGFKNDQQYCVAPIVGSSSPSTNMQDLWAIGLNCCEKDFEYGEYANAKAHGGLRLVRSDQAEFFRLAVKQAEAAYSLHAAQPTFFYWVQDPVAELSSYADDAVKLYWLTCCTFFAYQVAITTLVMTIFRKFGVE